MITSAKPDGANPGFFVKTPDKTRYLFKFDGAIQPLRASAADVVGSKIYWAAGYNAPCNQIVDFDVALLALDPEGKAKNEYDEDIPLTQAHVAQVLRAATKNADGTLRAVASEFVPGEPLGPWTFDGRQFAGWVPHQHVTYLWPSGPWYWLWDTLGAPDWLAHRLWLGTLFLLAGSAPHAPSLPLRAVSCGHRCGDQGRSGPAHAATA